VTAAPESDRGLYAYAITREYERDPLAMPDSGVHTVEHRGLAVVVAEVDLAPFTELSANTEPWTAAPAADDPLVVLARRHDDVVRGVFERRPVLPLRFGTILRDHDAAVRLLTDRYPEARELLDLVAGHREWGVRARRTRPPEPEPKPADGLSGTEYLALRGRKLAATKESRDREADSAAAVHTALTAHATACAARPKRDPALLSDTAYLVAEDRESAFHTEVTRFDGISGIALEVTGPWPPYSFADLPEVAGHD
jgi:hypothetical protein